MSKSIKSLNDTLAFQLEGVYDVVKRLQADLISAKRLVADPEMRHAFAKYSEDLNDQRLKLKRIFSYVLSGPYGRKSISIDHVIARMEEISDLDALPRLRDVALSTALQSMVSYLIATYTQARYIAMRLDLSKVVQLIDEILDTEEAFYQKLKGLSSAQINEACRMVTSN
jgi:ferritin-like metal-binding protein YciE